MNRRNAKIRWEPLFVLALLVACLVCPVAFVMARHLLEWYIGKIGPN